MMETQTISMDAQQLAKSKVVILAVVEHQNLMIPVKRSVEIK